MKGEEQIMRKLKRAVAKANMKKAGLVQICKGNKRGNKSYFALNWREWVRR